MKVLLSVTSDRHDDKDLESWQADVLHTAQPLQQNRNQSSFIISDV